MTARTHARRRTVLHRLGPALLWVALACAGPHAMAASWNDQVPEARLIGQGDMRWLGLRLYTAQLWSAAPRIGEREPYALVLNYHRRITREQLVDASIKDMQRVADTPPDEQRLERWRGYMMQAFRDVDEGDQMTGVYLPGSGCRFYLGNTLLASIDDAEFARVFFAVWLSPRTRDTDLRRQLLGAAP